ncbi:MAG: histidine kinase [Alkalinema sp. CACIAM 70d]|nr:MAG: histidine kinase [Alkalinema sp. CACIAM 70d]
MARLTNHHLPYQSFQLLLILEWLLLTTAVFMEVLLPFQPSWLLVERVITLTLFGLLGFSLPSQQIPQKLLYTLAEFGLMILAVTQYGLSTRSVFLMGLVLVMRSCFLFQQRGQLVVLGASLLTYAGFLLTKPIVLAKTTVWDWRLSNVLMFSLTLVFAFLLINALRSERQSREQLEKAHQELATTHAQLRQYALRIEDQATLQERNRIAREIHDGLGHTLAAQTIQINNAILFWQSDPPQALTFLKEAKQLGAAALLEVRKSVSMLRSTPLQGQTLEVALEKLFTDFQTMTGMMIRRRIQVLPPLPAEMNMALFRILQESLTNIAKHATATTATIELQTISPGTVSLPGTIPFPGTTVPLEPLTLGRPTSSRCIYLSIVDNGQGFNPTQNTTGFGLQGMRERAAALGGALTIQSHPHQGCTILVTLPLSPS